MSQLFVFRNPLSDDGGTVPTGKINGTPTLHPSMVAKESYTQKELKSLTGKLRHVTIVGKTFMRRMFELQSGVNQPYHYVCLNTDRHPMVGHIPGIMEWGQYGTFCPATFHSHLDGCVRLLWMWNLKTTIVTLDSDGMA